MAACFLKLPGSVPFLHFFLYILFPSSLFSFSCSVLIPLPVVPLQCRALCWQGVRAVQFWVFMRADSSTSLRPCQGPFVFTEEWINQTLLSFSFCSEVGLPVFYSKYLLDILRLFSSLVFQIPIFSHLPHRYWYHASLAYSWGLMQILLLCMFMWFLFLSLPSLLPFFFPSVEMWGLFKTTMVSAIFLDFLRYLKMNSNWCQIQRNALNVHYVFWKVWELFALCNIIPSNTC